MKICNIFAAGELDCNECCVFDADINIAADKGWLNAEKLGIKPDVLVGDFDSLDFIPGNVEIIKHPVQKDDTDTLLAVRIGLERGCNEFYIYGATGGRLDHTVANIQTLHFIAENGARGYIVGEENITVIKNSYIRFTKDAKGTVSVFSLNGTSNGVCIEGLFYELNDAELTSVFPVGVSNEFVGKEAKIGVKDGFLTVFWQDSINILKR